MSYTPSRKPQRNKPIEGLINSDDKGEEFKHDLKRSLEYGDMPEFIIETEHLIGEGESASADKVIDYIRGVMTRITRKNNQTELPPLEIYLSDQSVVNASVIPGYNKPFLIISMGLLEHIVDRGFGEDHLASILGHEKFHLQKSRNEGWRDIPNGRPEEAIADVFGVKESFDAGYNPRAAGLLLSSLIEEEKETDGKNTSWGEVLTLFDEHPPYALSFRSSSASAVRTSSKSGAAPINISPMAS